MTSPAGLPASLRQLSIEQLRDLAEDLRQEILSVCLKNGGHLGASLGTVELAIALHRVFESPREPIVWDVGHQAYAHKLLTGRWQSFKTLRTTGGISGFLSRDESEHDVFGAGHSSTALSASLAMAWAKRAKGDPESWTVAVVGDGGLTAGLALEALNNVRAVPTGPLLVVVNDNQMSISQNVGSLPTILSGGGAADFFGQFGFDYVGPLDGHDLAQLVGTLEGLKGGYAGKPLVLHVLTQKGKGYIPAEEHPSAFHGINPIQPKGAKARSYSDAFSDAVCAAAGADPSVVAITAAMPEGTGLTAFSRRYPDRFFDVGIAEPHAVTFAAGLATQGIKPVVAIYSTFLQRALDSTIHDVVLQKLPVVFCVDRAGLVGADGPTHHGVFDLAYLSMIPGLRVLAPSCLADMARLLKEAIASGGPCAIRYPRGSGPEDYAQPIEDGLRWHTSPARPEAIAIALGAAAPRLEKACRGLEARVLFASVTRAKPIPQALIEKLGAHPGLPVLVAEDGVAHGGFGEALLAASAPRIGKWDHAAYPDRFLPHGAVADLEEQAGVSAAALETRLRSLL